MRPAKKTSPVKKPRGGGPVPRPSKRGPGVTGKRPPPRPRQQKKPTPFPGSSADMKRGKGRLVGRPTPVVGGSRPTPVVGGKRKRISADKVKGPINLGGSNVGKKGVIGTVGGKDVVNKGGRLPPKGSSAVKQRKLSPAALKRKRAADLRRRRRQELSAANKANRSAVRSDNKQAASDLAKFNAARKRQAKKATPTARRTAKPVGDRRVPVSRRVPFRDTGKPPTARRTAKPVGDRRVPVSRRIRQR